MVCLLTHGISYCTELSSASDRPFGKHRRTKRSAAFGRATAGYVIALVTLALPRQRACVIAATGSRRRTSDPERLRTRHDRTAVAPAGAEIKRRNGSSEPFLLIVNVNRVEFLLAFHQIDDAFDEGNKAHDHGRQTEGEQASQNTDGQHDEARLVIA